MIGDYEPLGLTVWYNKHSLANILTMKDTQRVARITMNTMVAPAIAAQKYGEDDTIMVFEECEIGLYRHDTANIQTLKINDEHRINDEHSGFSFINTVEGNKEGFTQRQIEKANQAIALYHIIGRPVERKFYTILSGNHIMNCPITVEDARQAFHIYGPDVATLRGKMVRQTPKAIPDYIPFKLTPDLLKEFRQINLATDILFVQGHAHQHTICQQIKFSTIEQLKNMTKVEILKSLKKVITLYTTRGFSIEQIMADNQYECLRDDLLPIMLTIVGAGEHVGDIKQSIRTIKEVSRTTTPGLPFKRYPWVLIDAILQKSVGDRNTFPEENRVSKEMSPRTIVTGHPKIDYNDCKLELGQYCEVYTHPDPTNRQHTRSVSGIALLPLNNNGGYTFMSLMTGKRIHSYIWKALSMTRDVIQMVDCLGKKENQSIINKGGIMFEWAPGEPIFDDEDDVNAFDDNYESEQDDNNTDRYLDDNDYNMTDNDSNADAVEDQRSVVHDDDGQVNNNDGDDEADEADEQNNNNNEELHNNEADINNEEDDEQAEGHNTQHQVTDNKEDEDDNNEEDDSDDNSTSANDESENEETNSTNAKRTLQLKGATTKGGMTKK